MTETETEKIVEDFEFFIYLSLLLISNLRANAFNEWKMVYQTDRGSSDVTQPKSFLFF